MFFLEVETRRQTCRLISAALVLFVFFLPLHFHFNTSAKVAQECACVHGARTQLALSSALTTCALIITAQPVIVDASAPLAIEWSGLQSVRAPPASLSV
jgi:hypothetical protein